MRVDKAKVSGNGLVHEVKKEAGWWTVSFMSEPRTSPQPLWFHLEAEDVGGLPVRFVWMNGDQCLGNARQLPNDKPVLRVDDGDWTRCENTRMEETSDGQHRLVFEYPKPCDSISAAFCFPYSTADLNSTLAEIRAVPEVIGVTGKGRPLTRVRVFEEGKIGVYISARQHSGETTGSWVMDGLLRSLSPDIDWWIVPFVDLDGVEDGDYGKDAHPCDFNRSWENQPMRPEVLSIQRDMRRFAGRYSRRLVLDLHSPGHGEEGMWVFLPRSHRPADQRAEAEYFVAALASVFTEVDPSKLKRETTYASRWNMDATLCAWVWDALKIPASSIETSYQRIAGKTLEIADYRDIGRRLVQAILNYFGSVR